MYTHWVDVKTLNSKRFKDFRSVRGGVEQWLAGQDKSAASPRSAKDRCFKFYAVADPPSWGGGTRTDRRCLR